MSIITIARLLAYVNYMIFLLSPVLFYLPLRQLPVQRPHRADQLALRDVYAVEQTLQLQIVEIEIVQLHRPVAGHRQDLPVLGEI